MKKRILLSLVSFFAMTSMWASLQEAYKITVSGDNGKANGKATLTLSMNNQKAIATWTCTVALPEGVTFVEGSQKAEPARYPEAYGEPNLVAVANADGSVTFTCSGAAGATLTGTDGAVATFEVQIGAVTPGDYKVFVNNATMFEADGVTYHDYAKTEFVWTIEEGGVIGDTTGDGSVDGADYQKILNIMSVEGYDASCDINGDGSVDGIDAQQVLNIMSTQE
jgi:hypothetical protein